MAGEVDPGSGPRGASRRGRGGERVSAGGRAGGLVNQRLHGPVRLLRTHRYIPHSHTIPCPLVLDSEDGQVRAFRHKVVRPSQTVGVSVGNSVRPHRVPHTHIAPGLPLSGGRDSPDHEVPGRDGRHQHLLLGHVLRRRGVRSLHACPPPDRPPRENNERNRVPGQLPHAHHARVHVRHRGVHLRTSRQCARAGGAGRPTPRARC